MIFDHISRKDNYKDYPLLYQALTYLSTLPPHNTIEHTQVLIPDVLFCNPVAFVSKPEAECKYEAHQAYIDLHYIVEGTESIATADVTALDVLTPYAEDKDIGFWTGSEDGRYTLKPGQFMVCFPHDAHKVGMMDGQPGEIKKIVFKIKA